jgi:hypothetical protein
MSGNGLMNDAWLGQTVEPPKTGQTRPAASGVGAKTFLPWKRVQEAFFSWLAILFWTARNSLVGFVPSSRCSIRV